VNNNARRRLERRQEQRRNRHRSTSSAATDPITVPPAPGERCAICMKSPASTRGGINTGRGELIFPVCEPCTRELPGLLAREGFTRVRRTIAENLKGQLP
jgi:hypothetical protein